MRRMVVRRGQTREGVQRSAVVRSIWTPDGSVAPADGLAALATTAVVYGQSIAPALYYLGSGYNGTTWTGVAGPTLALGGSGTAPSIVAAPTVGAGDKAVQLPGTSGKYLTAGADTASGNIALEDAIIEIWYKPDATALSPLVSKGSPTSASWYFYSNPNPALALRDGAAHSTAGQYGTGTSGVWKHVVIGIDRDHATGCFAIHDGVLNAQQRNPTAVLSMSNAYALYIGGTPSLAPNSAGAIAQFALWVASPGWVDASSKTTLETWAAARYAVGMGL